MPKDNNQTQNPQNNTAPVADDMPPIMMEDTHPPMINEGEQATVISDQPLPAVTPPATDSGSAAPADDIVMPSVVTSGPNVKSPTKKFGGGKVIATILGLFLLVGGVGAGVMLTQQNQDIREQASGGCSSNSSKSSCESSCGSPKADGKTYSCRWSSESGECKESGNECGGNTDVGGSTTKSTCESSGGYWCFEVVDIYQKTVPAFCLSNTAGITCAQQANNLGYIVPTGGGGPGEGGFRCVVGEGKDYPYVAGTQCVEGNSVQVIGNSNPPPSCFCGTIQIDGGTYNGTYTSTCGCGGNETNPPATTPPAISAVCQDVKAYSTNNWTLLTPTVLSTLKAGDSVNFCVTGSASSGSFNKARFTINNVLQAETTTVRPGSTDYCQLYNIPTGVTTFNVSAQINHITLGWK